MNYGEGGHQVPCNVSSFYLLQMFSRLCLLSKKKVIVLGENNTWSSTAMRAEGLARYRVKTKFVNL